MYVCLQPPRDKVPSAAYLPLFPLYFMQYTCEGGVELRTCTAIGRLPKPSALPEIADERGAIDQTWNTLKLFPSCTATGMSRALWTSELH